MKDQGGRGEDASRHGGPGVGGIQLTVQNGRTFF
jgi:hypothetical protein